MAGKNVSGVEIELARFTDMIEKNGFKFIYFLNKEITAGGPKGDLIVHVSDDLWKAISESSTLKDKMIELDISRPDDRILADRYEYCKDDDDWIDIDSEKMYNGSIIHISIEEYKYQVPINKNLFIIKFKKAEANNFSYKLVRSPRLALVLRKKYISLDGKADWSIYRIFQVL